MSGLVRLSTGGMTGSSSSARGEGSGGGGGSSVNLKELRHRLNMLKGQIKLCLTVNWHKKYQLVQFMMVYVSLLLWES